MTGTTTPFNPKALARWQAFAPLLMDPNTELDIETFGPIVSTFSQLERQGYPFDPTLCALMTCLKRQAFHHDGESDEDHTYHARINGREVLPTSEYNRAESRRTA